MIEFGMVLFAKDGYYIDEAQQPTGDNPIQGVQNNIITFDLDDLEIIDSETSATTITSRTPVKPGDDVYVVSPEQDLFQVTIGDVSFTPGYLDSLLDTDHTITQITTVHKTLQELTQYDNSVIPTNDYSDAATATFKIKLESPKNLLQYTLLLNLNFINNARYLDSDDIRISSGSGNLSITMTHDVGTTETQTISGLSEGTQYVVLLGYDSASGGTFRIYNFEDGSQVDSVTFGQQTPPTLFTYLDIQTPINGLFLLDFRLSDTNMVDYSSTQKAYSRYVFDITPLGLSNSPYKVYFYNEPELYIAVAQQESDITDSSFVKVNRKDILYNKGRFIATYNDYRGTSGYVIQRKFKPIRDEGNIRLLNYNSDLFM